MRRTLLALLLLLAALPAAAQPDGTALDLYSNPPGALVALDHRVLGHTPIRLSPIVPGDHELRISAGADYKPYVVIVHVQAGIVQRLDVELEPAPPLLVRQGVQAMEAGRDDEALSLFQRATKEPEAWWWIGALQMRRGRNAEALQAFRNYADFFPNNPALYERLGTLHERMGHRAEAVTAYKLALLNREGMKDALQGLPSRPTWADIAAMGSPGTPREQLRLAYLYEQKGRFDEALRWLHAALEGVD